MKEAGNILRALLALGWAEACRTVRPGIWSREAVRGTVVDPAARPWRLWLSLLSLHLLSCPWFSRHFQGITHHLPLCTSPHPSSTAHPHLPVQKRKTVVVRINELICVKSLLRCLVHSKYSTNVSYHYYFVVVKIIVLFVVVVNDSKVLWHLPQGSVCSLARGWLYVAHCTGPQAWACSVRCTG